jgi:endonuclease G
VVEKLKMEINVINPTMAAYKTNQPARDKSNTLLWVLILFIIVLLVVLYTCHKQKTATSRYSIDTTALQQLQIPAIRPTDEIVQHKAYTLSYNEEDEQASWVAYVLSGQQLASAHFERTNKFLKDPLVKTGSADDEDYDGSGYDRGHLAPAEDMSWSKETMKESFYYSNMSPQVPAFNRGVWRRLEELVRYWSSAYDSIYVVTGPVLTPGLPTIGPDKVAVPEYYYKVILEYNPKGVKGIGFLLRNEESAATLKNFAVSIDSVEHLTGLDFFPRLPDDAEEKIESQLNARDWLWTRKRTNHSKEGTSY